MKRYEFFGVEWDDLDVLVIYFVVLAVFFHILLLEILYYEERIVIFQIMEDYGKEKLEITIVATGKEELTREVIMVTDFPVTVIEWSFTVLADCGVGVV